MDEYGNPLYLYEPLARTKEEVKALTQMPHGQGYNSYPIYSSWASFDAAYSRDANTNIDYAQKVGPPDKSSLIMSAVRWLGNTLPEAPLQVEEPSGDKSKQIPNHKLLDLLRKPNLYYAGDSLWTAFAYSWIIDGNVYLIKIKNQTQTAVVELWYEPHWSIRPRWVGDNKGAWILPTVQKGRAVENWKDKPALISYYELDRNNQKYRIEVDDVVHFRDGNDPYMPQFGWSYIRSIYREIYGDNEVSNFQSRLFGGSAVPPFMVEINENISFDKEKAQMMAADLKRKTSGDNKGEPIVIWGGKPHKLSWSPSELDLKMLHRFSEERFCAVTGIPAVVLGLGVGHDHSIFNNVAQADKRAYEAYLKPLYRRIAAQINLQLLPDFEKEGSKLYTTHDLSKLSAAQEDVDSKSKRIERQYIMGVIDLAQACSELNYPVEEWMRGYYSPKAGGVSKPVEVESDAPTKSISQPSEKEVDRAEEAWLRDAPPEAADLINAVKKPNGDSEVLNG